MIASPDASAVREFLARTQKRLTWIAAADGAGRGFLVATVLSIAISRAEPFSSWILYVAASLVCIATSVVLVRRRVPRASVEVERRLPECQNLIVTADELIDEPGRVPAYISERVFREAAQLTRTLDASRLFPANHAVMTAPFFAVMWIATIGLIVSLAPRPDGVSSSAQTESGIGAVEITVTPPAYSDRPSQRSVNPTRVTALAGSRITLSARANADSVSIETLTGRRALASVDRRTFTGVVIADADGFIAIEAHSIDGSASGRRLIGLSVIADGAPQVKATAPGRDLLLPDPNRSIDVVIEATDDLALASLALRYTKVSGSGEQFTFTEGVVPVQVTKVDDRTWRARGTLQLAGMALEAGDMVVYRGAATDRRPGAVAAESDAYIVEITAPGAVAAEGFAIDDERDRYALSQQMVVIKTERLIARAPSMPADSLLREAMTLAAEQRSVRAEFVFMMGGELAEEVLAAAGLGDLNEEAHIAADDEAIAGRIANQGRLALVLAIRSMSRANTALNRGDLTRALAAEKAALDQLERAFSRTRYILRALTQREQLDLSRRLTGELAGVTRSTRPLSPPELNPRVLAMRRVLASIAAAAANNEVGPAARISALAQEVLQIDPSAAVLQPIAAALDAAATASSDGQDARARTQLDRAATLLAEAVRAELTDAPRTRSEDASRLDGALVDALNRPGSR
ncbi:MAG: hypothetical protein WEE89_12860 [Gemmatimonadota bacterium]